MGRNRGAICRCLTWLSQERKGGMGRKRGAICRCLACSSQEREGVQGRNRGAICNVLLSSSQRHPAGWPCTCLGMIFSRSPEGLGSKTVVVHAKFRVLPLASITVFSSMSSTRSCVGRPLLHVVRCEWMCASIRKQPACSTGGAVGLTFQDLLCLATKKHHRA